MKSHIVSILAICRAWLLASKKRKEKECKKFENLY
jgi:hypothetical protein